MNFRARSQKAKLQFVGKCVATPITYHNFNLIAQMGAQEQ